MSGKTALGGRDLPEEQQAALRRAIRLEWVTLAVLAVTVAAVYSVSGQSQAMKAACQMPDRLYFDIDVSGAI